MAAHDLLLKIGGVNDTIGKNPYFRTAGVEYTVGPPITYLGNSLEGALFNDNGSGAVTVGAGDIYPNFNFFSTVSAPGTVNIVDGASPAGLTRTNGIITVNIVGHGLSVNDIFSLKSVTFNSTHERDLNGVYKVFQVLDNDHFQFIKLGENFIKTEYTYPLAVTLFKYSDPAIQIFDNRDVSSVSGLSYTSVLLSPKIVTDVTGSGEDPARRRITPEDLYIRFRIVNKTELSGGLNSNIFDVVDIVSGENVKPIIWAWFFGGLTKTTASDFTSADRTPNNIFDIIFNSYAIVLRPTGGGSYLEFALLKFNWGSVTDGITGNWFTNFIDTPLINKYDNVNGTDLGYLISSNPNVAKTSNVSRIVELATSSSFFYDSEVPLKVNLKISIRKHLLTDQSTDNTYYFQLAKNDDYNSFGDGTVYSDILHSFITRPKTDGLTVINILAGGYTPAVASDIGKDIKDGATTVGQLAWFDNTNKIWWAKNVSTAIPSSTSLTINTGTGAGTTTGVSVFDSSLSFVNPIGTVNTVQSNYLLMPWMYLKFVNVEPTSYQTYSSKMIIDNVLFKQLNSNSKLYY